MRRHQTCPAAVSTTTKFHHTRRTNGLPRARRGFPSFFPRALIINGGTAADLIVSFVGSCVAFSRRQRGGADQRRGPKDVGLWSTAAAMRWRRAAYLGLSSVVGACCLGILRPAPPPSVVSLFFCPLLLLFNNFYPSLFILFSSLISSFSLRFSTLFYFLYPLSSLTFSTTTTTS